MRTKTVAGVTLFFNAAERETADLIGHACAQSVPLINQCWGLDTPRNCRVYVMTSWLHFVFHAAPWSRRVLYALLLPVWYFRAKKMWKLAGGWTLSFSNGPAVGVKPPWLVQLADRHIGARIFIKEKDTDQKVRYNTCHELTHAFTHHLKLPLWLNEGLAMVTVDKFAGQPTVRKDTLATLGRSSDETRPGEYRDTARMDQDALVYHVARGYWLTRYLQDTQPELLTSLLSQRYSKKALESKIATALGMSHQEFWNKVDGVVAAYFEQKQGAGQPTR